MKIQKSILFLLLSAVALYGQVGRSWAAGLTNGTTDVKGVVRLASIGDSITVGAGVSDRATKSYPTLLGQWLGAKWNVKNFGASGSTLLKKGNLPYWERPHFKKALAFKPDVAVVMLGTNDSKHGAKNNPKIANNWQHKADFVDDYKALLAEFRKVNPNVKLYLCLPVPAFAPNRYGIDGMVIKDEIVPLVREVAALSKAQVIDLHRPLEGKPELLRDRVHPNDAGTRLIAAHIYRVLSGKEAPPETDTVAGAPPATATAPGENPVATGTVTIDAPPTSRVLASAGVVTPTVVTPPAKENFHIYLLMGQSNMAGRDTQTLALQVENRRVLALNTDDQWTVARDPLHPRQGRTEPGAGPGIPFALEMLKADPTITIGLVPCAVGGSSLRSWVKGAEHYEKALSRAKNASQRGIIKGVLWHQGESDTDKKSNAESYETRLTKMLGDLRQDLGLPNLPVVVGQLGDFLTLTPAKYPYAETVRTAIKHIPTVVPGVGYVDSAGLANKGDKLHFSAEAAKELGARYAKVMQKLQKSLQELQKQE
jgi:lysophospholipase L1-like esterase